MIDPAVHNLTQLGRLERALKTQTVLLNQSWVQEVLMALVCDRHPPQLCLDHDQEAHGYD